MTMQLPAYKAPAQPFHLPVGKLMMLAMVLLLILPSIAFGQTDTAGDAINTTCTFAKNIKAVLNAVSIVVVTVAVIFCGYQIAFAHKRIGEVAPIFIGAILIGAASQIASMFLTSSSQTAAASGGTCTGSITTHALDHYASVAVHFLSHYA
jgi:type IV secretion system protein VirB2